MSRRSAALVVLAGAAVLVAGFAPGAALAAAGATAVPDASERVCADPAPGYAACQARLVVAAPGRAYTSALPSGYGPKDLQSAYKLPSATAGGGQTIAIVDAYDNPKAESDLAVYRRTYGLPPCTTANGCFKKVNQSGQQGSYPKADSGWAAEISLDLDMASAICSRCKILLVEATSPRFGNLGKAVDTAARLGANTISNSYGAPESGSALSYESHYNHPGTVITVSSGDSGYGVSFPASSRYVTAVGGTTLKRASTGRGWAETAWSRAGSGCSASVPQPSWQPGIGGCSRRQVADVSAVADPRTGVAVYDTYNEPGWLVFGGTSASAPIIAAVYNLAGNARSVNYGSYPYAHRSGVFDVTSGSNGSCGTALCKAATGYDGPTGLGTPNGTSAF